MAQLENIMKLSIIGSGDWDTKLIEVFDALGGEHVFYSSYEHRLQKVTQPPIGPGVHLIYGNSDHSPWSVKGFHLTEDIGKILSESDAVVIASVISDRYKYAHEALEAGCHVWIEPPMAFNAKDAYGLVKSANEKDKLLFVGHRLCYSSLLASMLPFGADRDIIRSVEGIHKRRYIKGPEVNPLWLLGTDMVALQVYLGLPFSKFMLDIDSHAREDEYRVEVEFKNGFIFTWDILKNEEDLLTEAAKAFLISIETKDHYARTDGEHGLEVVRALEFFGQ
jgi:hypothetical protein